MTMNLDLDQGRKERRKTQHLGWLFVPQAQAGDVPGALEPALTFSSAGGRAPTGQLFRMSPRAADKRHRWFRLLLDQLWTSPCHPLRAPRYMPISSRLPPPPSASASPVFPVINPITLTANLAAIDLVWLDPKFPNI